MSDNLAEMDVIHELRRICEDLQKWETNVLHVYNTFNKIQDKHHKQKYNAKQLLLQKGKDLIVADERSALLLSRINELQLLKHTQTTSQISVGTQTASGKDSVKLRHNEDAVGSSFDVGMSWNEGVHDNMKRSIQTDKDASRETLWSVNSAGSEKLEGLNIMPTEMNSSLGWQGVRHRFNGMEQTVKKEKKTNIEDRETSMQGYKEDFLRQIIQTTCSCKIKKYLERNDSNELAKKITNFDRKYDLIVKHHSDCQQTLRDIQKENADMKLRLLENKSLASTAAKVNMSVDNHKCRSDTSGCYFNISPSGCAASHPGAVGSTGSRPGDESASRSSTAIESQNASTQLKTNEHYITKLAAFIDKLMVEIDELIRQNIEKDLRFKKLEREKRKLKAKYELHHIKRKEHTEMLRDKLNRNHKSFVESKEKQFDLAKQHDQMMSTVTDVRELLMMKLAELDHEDQTDREVQD